MTTATLTKFDIRSIIVNLSNTELHNCIADDAVTHALGEEASTALRDEARERGLL